MEFDGDHRSSLDFARSLIRRGFPRPSIRRLMALAFDRAALATIRRCMRFLVLRRGGVCARSAALRLSGRDAIAAPDEAGLSPLELLGKRIFEDRRLSEPAGLSCASCHDPAPGLPGQQWLADRGALARQPAGRCSASARRPRSPMPPSARAFTSSKKKDEETGETEMVPAGGQFWDGRADDLVAQVERAAAQSARDEQSVQSRRGRARSRPATTPISRGASMARCCSPIRTPPSTN